MELDRNVRIDAVDGRSGARNLGLANFGRAVDDLPLQVREANLVAADDPQGSDTGGGEIKQDWRAKPARPHNEDARALQRSLTRASDVPQDNMAGITFKFFGTKHGAA